MLYVSPEAANLNVSTVSPPSEEWTASKTVRGVVAAFEFDHPVLFVVSCFIDFQIDVFQRQIA